MQFALTGSSFLTGREFLAFNMINFNKVTQRRRIRCKNNSEIRTFVMGVLGPQMLTNKDDIADRIFENLRL